LLFSHPPLSHSLDFPLDFPLDSDHRDEPIKGGGYKKPSPLVGEGRVRGKLKKTYYFSYFILSQGESHEPSPPRRDLSR
jgi:hypothetical protein